MKLKKASDSLLEYISHVFLIVTAGKKMIQKMAQLCELHVTGNRDVPTCFLPPLSPIVAPLSSRNALQTGR